MFVGFKILPFLLINTFQFLTGISCWIDQCFLNKELLVHNG
jgi:hypothetical protein